jgi:hypothetical protein
MFGAMRIEENVAPQSRLKGGGDYADIDTFPSATQSFV